MTLKRLKQVVLEMKNMADGQALFSFGPGEVT